MQKIEMNQKYLKLNSEKKYLDEDIVVEYTGSTGSNGQAIIVYTEDDMINKPTGTVCKYLGDSNEKYEYGYLYIIEEG